MWPDRGISIHCYRKEVKVLASSKRHRGRPETSDCEEYNAQAGSRKQEMMLEIVILGYCDIVIIGDVYVCAHDRILYVLRKDRQAGAAFMLLFQPRRHQG